MKNQGIDLKVYIAKRGNGMAVVQTGSRQPREEIGIVLEPEAGYFLSGQIVMA